MVGLALEVDSKTDIENDDKNIPKARIRSGKTMQSGVCHYATGDILLKQTTLQSDMYGLVGKAVIIGHVKLSELIQKEKEIAKGYVTEIWFNEYDGWWHCKFTIDDEELNDALDKGEYYLSTAYVPIEKKGGGTESGINYQEEYTSIEFTHLALVKNPRYEEAEIYNNKKKEEFNMKVWKKLGSMFGSEQAEEKLNENEQAVKDMFTEAITEVFNSEAIGTLIEEKFNAIAKKNMSDEEKKKEEEAKKKKEAESKDKDKKEKKNDGEDLSEEEKVAKEKEEADAKVEADKVATEEAKKKEEEEKVNSLENLEAVKPQVIQAVDLNNKYGRKR